MRSRKSRLGAGCAARLRAPAAAALPERRHAAHGRGGRPGATSPRSPGEWRPGVGLVCWGERGGVTEPGPCFRGPPSERKGALRRLRWSHPPREPLLFRAGWCKRARRLLRRHGRTLGSPQFAYWKRSGPPAWRVRPPAAPASCPAARCPRLRRPRGPAAPEGPGRDSLPGDRLAGTKPPANPQRAWEEAAVIRLVTAGTALSSRAENEELAFGGGAGV